MTGYGSRYKLFQKAIQSKFGPNPAISMNFEATTHPSSKFEVTVNGTLHHTKIGVEGLPPSGFPDTEAKLTPIIAAIEEALG